MYIGSKIQLSLIRWIFVVGITLTNTGFVRSVIVQENYPEWDLPNPLNNTCHSVMYNGQDLYQCELNLKARETSDRLMLRFDLLQLNCSDMLSVYDSSDTFGTPAYRFTCVNNTERVGIGIYSTDNALSIEYKTADEHGFDSNAFYLIYASFKDTTNGCDGFVCREENKYCFYPRAMCDSVNHCSDGSDESDCLAPDHDEGEVKLIALVCFVSSLILLGVIWLCAHTRKVMRNRRAIQQNGINNN